MFSSFYNPDVVEIEEFIEPLFSELSYSEMVQKPTTLAHQQPAKKQNKKTALFDLTDIPFFPLLNPPTNTNKKSSSKIPDTLRIASVIPNLDHDAPHTPSQVKVFPTVAFV